MKSDNHNQPPRETARAFTPELSALVEDPLFSQVWADDRLSARERSLATLAALIVLHRPEELPAHLRRAIDNGLEKPQISALITHLAFYGGFPSAISASAIAAEVLGALNAGSR
jgi:4-carboxymuconolactone decarboxylase